MAEIPTTLPLEENLEPGPAAAEVRPQRGNRLDGGETRPGTTAPRPRVSNEALAKTALDENAQVWTVYCAEADRYDTERLQGWKDTIQTLTIFSGLFSVVVISIGTDLRPSSSDGSTDYHTSLWVYTLWFTSITLSLAIPIVCLNAQQWLHTFRASSTNVLQHPRHRALARQLRYSGLEQWNVPLILGLLPQFLILSIFLFFAGLIVLIRPLSQMFSTAIVTVAGGAFFLYIMATISPILSPQCPFCTPLTHLVYDLLRHFGIFPDISSDTSLAHKELKMISDPHGHVLAASALNWLYTNTTDPNVHSTVYEALAGFERTLASSNIGPDLVREIQDATTLSFKYPNVVFGLFRYVIRSATEDAQWIRSKQGRRLARACRFYFGREDESSERLWAQVNSPDCADSTFADTVRNVLRIANDHPPSRSRRGVHFPPGRILDRQGNRSNPAVATREPVLPRSISGTLMQSD